MTSALEKPRHFLIVRRHSDGLHVGFLCHNDDVSEWEKGMDWGTIVSAHPITFTDDDTDTKRKRQAVQNLQDALDRMFRDAHRPDHHDSLLHAVEQLIGMAFDAGSLAGHELGVRAARSEVAREALAALHLPSPEDAATD